MAPVDLSSLRAGIPAELPTHPGPHPDTTIPNAPRRRVDLTQDELVLAVQNALRYFPAHQHDVLAPEFAQELKEEGHIYMHRHDFSVLMLLCTNARGVWKRESLTRMFILFFVWVQIPSSGV